MLIIETVQLYLNEHGIEHFNGAIHPLLDHFYFQEKIRLKTLIILDVRIKTKKCKLNFPSAPVGPDMLAYLVKTSGPREVFL